MTDDGRHEPITSEDGVKATREARPDLPSETVEAAETRAPNQALAHPVMPPGWKGCVAQTRAGGVCLMPARENSNLCWSHSPGLAAEAGRQGGLTHRHGNPRVRRHRGSVDADAPIATMPDAPLETPEQIAELRTAAIRAVQRGQMAPDVGLALSKMLSDALRDVEAVDIARRLDALEGTDDDEAGEPS